MSGAELSVDTLERRLGVRQRARADGAAGAPAPEAEGLSGAEREILDVIDRERAQQQAARVAALTALSQELRRLDPEPTDIDAPFIETQLALRQIEGRATPEFAELRAQATLAKSELESFRRTHAIRRPALYPASPILQAGMLIFAAAFESLFSAALFAQTSEMGLLGGAAIALGLSGANVSLGFLTGFLGLRYLGARSIVRRIAGGIGLAVFAGLALGLNLFAAAWRESIDADPALSGPIASLGRADLFGLTAPEAVILLMLGGGVWVFSTLKGYSGFDDPYPDYGKMDRAARDSTEALAARREELRDDLEGALESGRAAANAQIDAMRARLEEMRAAYDRGAARVHAGDSACRRLDETAAALIDLYRRENLAVRTGAAPAYFAEPPPLPIPPVDALDAAGASVARAQKRLADSQAALGAKLAALGDALEAVSARLDGVA